jgi:lipopolysaccharide export system permease protein
MRLLFPRKATQYLFFEMLPSLIIGVVVFLSIMIMFQAIHYTEFVLIHGVSLLVVMQMMGFICISFLPALLPMALLFSVLMTYGRLSQDSEIIALKASGYSMWWIFSPAIALGLMISILSAETSFHLAPWGNRQFEILISHLEQSKAGTTIREGTFSEGFFDLVVYAKEVDPKNGLLQKIFIYDERSGDVPLTVIARQGKILQGANLDGRTASLRLIDGAIHRQGESHTKIKFTSFDVRLFDQTKEQLRAKTPPSLTIEEVSEQLKEPTLSKDDRRDLEVEYHKRWAISIVCIVFAALGVALGTTANSRQQKNSGLILSLLVVVFYWGIYVTAESAARAGQLPVIVAIWIPNLLFALLTLWRLKKVWD